jgi:two-component system, NtrC family, sensor kinase
LIQDLKGERMNEDHTNNKEIAQEILNDIEQNLDKVLHHGRRADAIVKGMLQHSRNSTGSKEPTDINALADEYLRLAYHGLRAKDKQFNVDIKTDFDDSVGTINVVPRDIGRVLLNLYNNAFYAVKSTSPTNGEQYAPSVKVTTKRVRETVEIRIADNGPGIPHKIVDKIFQPFFTTKPTGQGTGLGLSLSYDIIKAHRGEITVESNEGKGSEFVILLHRNQA